MRKIAGPSDYRAVRVHTETSSEANLDSVVAATLSTDAATSRRMARQRTAGTSAELALRRVLYARGCRYRVNRPLEGLTRRRADLTFASVRLVVFVDGCFWHSCPDHGTSPKRNDAWWAAKLQRNAERDRETDHHLEVLGWTVVRVWEHEAPEDAADRIMGVIRSIREGR